MNWIKVLNSPFKFPKIKLYFGKIAVGVPYFYPRKWVKIKGKDNLGWTKAVPTKWWGYNHCELGWKTKWEDDDYRFEWNPIYSLVFLKMQFCVIICPKHPDHYWTSWLYYERNTDKKATKEERLKQCIKEFPQNYIIKSSKGEERVDYYKLILKRKYLK